MIGINTVFVCFCFNCFLSLLKILNELIHIKHSGYIVQVKLQRRRFTGRLNGYCSVFFSPSDEIMKNKVLTVKVRGMAQIHVQHITVRLMTLGLLPFFRCYQDQSCPKCYFQFSRYLCKRNLWTLHHINVKQSKYIAAVLFYALWHAKVMSLGFRQRFPCLHAGQYINTVYHRWKHSLISIWIG